MSHDAGHVRVGTDEARRDDLAGGVNDGGRAVGRLHLLSWADGDDPVALDGDRAIGENATIGVLRSYQSSYDEYVCHFVTSFNVSRLKYA
jgi:hypothetical protein